MIQKSKQDTEPSPVLLRCRGYYYDAETGFYYLQSRYYDPENCRFINADSIASTGQGFTGTNMFAYCNNCPVIFSDHTGHISKYASVALFDGGDGIHKRNNCSKCSLCQRLFRIRNCRSRTLSRLSRRCCDRAIPHREPATVVYAWRQNFSNYYTPGSVVNGYTWGYTDYYNQAVEVGAFWFSGGLDDRYYVGAWYGYYGK